MSTKVKIFSSLPLVLTVLLFGATDPASARKPIPGIQSTPQYKALASYVNKTLKPKQNTPATPAQKQAFRNNLSGRRLRADQRVKSLYRRQLARIENRDDRAERREIKRTQQKRSARIAQLNAEKAAQIAEAAARYRSRINQVNARYSTTITSKSANRRRLRAQLNRTTNPIRREVLLAKIENLGLKIRKLKSARKGQINQAGRQYQVKVDKLNSRFAQRIAGTKRFYKSLINLIQENWKKTFEADIAKVQTRRDSQFAAVKRLNRKGVGYIDEMPSPLPPS